MHGWSRGMAENYMMVVGCIYGGYCSKWYFAVRENRIVVEFVLYIYVSLCSCFVKASGYGWISLVNLLRSTVLCCDGGAFLRLCLSLLWLWRGG
jgi:hypothetical protein